MQNMVGLACAMALVIANHAWAPYASGQAAAPASNITPAGLTAAKEANNMNLEVRTDRKDAIYPKGATIKFIIDSKGIPADAEINYVVRRDGDAIVKSGKVQPGTAIEIKAEQPGFLKIDVTCKKLHSQAGCAIDPLLIKPGMPRPDDFKSFWEGKLKELAAVPMALRIKKIPAPTEAEYQAWNAKWPFFGDAPRKYMAIDVFEVEADTLGSEPLRGYYALPSGAAPKSLPAVLFTHAAGFGDSDIGKTCAAAQLGFLAMDINAHGLLIGQPAAYYAAAGKKIVDMDPAYRVTMYLRHRRALDFLCSRPEWNGQDLITRGYSQGGCLALTCAGLDERVSCVIATAPLPCAPRNNSKQAAGIDARYVAIESFAPNIKAEAYFMVGFLDPFCLPTDIYAAYNTYGGQKKIYNAPTADHDGIPRSICYDDCTIFMLEHVEKRKTNR